MQVGVVFPTTEIGTDVGLIRDYAQTAEALGYTHILAFDHVVGAVHEGRVPPLQHGYDEETAFHEPLALFAFLSGITSRIGLATGVLILPQRQAVLVAKQAAEVAILSGGRLRLGVGTGWNYVEYDSLGLPYADRGARLDEQVGVLRELWTTPVVDFTGQYHRIERAGIRPLPGVEIPVWFGGAARVAMRRAARLGDGFIFGGGSPVDLVGPLKEEIAAAGRDLAGFGIEGRVNYGRAPTPERWAAHLASWREAGATHVSMNTMNVGLQPREHIAAIQRFAEATGVKTP